MTEWKFFEDDFNLKGEDAKMYTRYRTEIKAGLTDDARQSIMNKLQDWYDECNDMDTLDAIDALQRMAESAPAASLEATVKKEAKTAPVVPEQREAYVPPAKKPIPKKPAPPPVSTNPNANLQYKNGEEFTVTRVDEKRKGGKMTYSMGLPGGKRIFFKDYKPKIGQKGKLVVGGNPRFFDATFEAYVSDSRKAVRPVAKTAAKKPAETGGKFSVPKEIKSLYDIVNITKAPKVWKDAIAKAKQFEVSLMDKKWPTYDHARKAVTEGRDYFSRFRKTVENGIVLEDYMSGLFLKVDEMSGTYDKDKGPGQKTTVPDARKVKVPKRAERTTSRSNVALDFNPKDLYFMLAQGSDGAQNPLAIQADKKLYTGDGRTLVDYIESHSENDFGESQRGSFRSLQAVVDSYKNAKLGRNQNKRYLINVNRKGARSTTTSFQPFWFKVSEMPERARHQIIKILPEYNEETNVWAA